MIVGRDGMCDPEVLTAIIPHEFAHLLISIASVGLPGQPGNNCTELAILWEDLTHICSQAAEMVSCPEYLADLCRLYEQVCQWIETASCVSPSCPGVSYDDPADCAACSG